MKISEAAHRYAKAIYELAQEAHEEEKTLEELRKVEQLFNSEQEIKDFIHTPLIREWEKKAALEVSLKERGLSLLVYHAILLLAEKDRLVLLPEIVTAYQERRDLDKGITRGLVKSAVPLSEDEKKSIQTTINNKTNKNVILSFEIDPSIIGGLIASVGGLTFNDSLDTHLRRINEELKRRAH